MSKKKLTIGCSSLSGTIFGGTLLKCGNVWSSDKQNVTNMAVSSVAEHLLHVEEMVEFTFKDELYIMKVEKKVQKGK
jgi:hypothetical protein